MPLETKEIVLGWLDKPWASIVVHGETKERNTDSRQATNVPVAFLWFVILIELLFGMHQIFEDTNESRIRLCIQWGMDDVVSLAML